jgi:glutaredoxin/glutathione-dependent peroxiredoxin
MTIKVGDRIPDVTVRTMGAEGPTTVSTTDVLGSGKVVLFAVPGAFTPGCSKVHLPSFVEGGAALKAEKGVDTIACIAVNDPFVMDAWGRSQGVTDDIVMLADGNAEFAEAIGMAQDGSRFGLGTRSKRYAAVLQDGVVQTIEVDEQGVDLTTCSSIALKI